MRRRPPLFGRPDADAFVDAAQESDTADLAGRNGGQPRMIPAHRQVQCRAAAIPAATIGQQPLALLDAIDGPRSIDMPSVPVWVGGSRRRIHGNRGGRRSL